MDELEWLRRNSPPTGPSADVTRRHRTELRTAIATEGADGTGPRRPRRRPRSRHRVLVSAVVVVVLCGVGAAIVALASGGGEGDDQNQIGAPATSDGATTTTTSPACTGTLSPALDIPAQLGTPVAGAAPNSSDPVEAGQQVTYWSSGTTTFEVRWPADADVRTQFGPSADANGIISFGHDSKATVDEKGTARRRSSAAYPNQPPACQTVQISVYGTDADAVNKLADTFNAKPFKVSEPLVTTTKSADSAPDVTPCAGPVKTAAAPAANVSDAKFVASVGGAVSRGTFAKPEDALADFVAGDDHLIQRGYEELQLPDGSLSFAVEVRSGAVVTVVHVIPAKEGWTVSDWSASGC